MKKIFYFSIISFFVGVALQLSWPDWNKTFFIFLLFTLFFVWLFLSFKQKKYFFLNLSLFALIFLLLGIGRTYLFQINTFSHHDPLLNTKITQDFIVVNEPEVKGWHSKLILQFIGSTDKAIAWIPHLPQYKYGDQLKISGWLLETKNFESEEGNDFDYINFLKKDHIFYEIKNPKIQFIASNQGNPIKEYLFAFKESIILQIKKLLPEPESSLLAGILIGAKEDLGEELLEDFRKTGIIHIVVLSGFNLTILAQFIMILLAIFGRKTSAIVGATSIILFAIMTGASATIVRASLMALLVILARALGRNSEAIKLLFLAGFIMLLFNPMLLLYDASFQLSFLATLGLLVLSPKIEAWVKVGDFKIINFKEILAATLSTQIFVFPLLLYMMGELSIIAPVVNLLILLLVPFTMIWGIITIILSYLWFELALFLSFLNHLILFYDFVVVDFFAHIEYATFQYHHFSVNHMLLAYMCYFLVFITWKYYQKKKKTIE